MSEGTRETAQDAAVTRIVDRIPRAGREAALEGAIKRLNAAAARYPGYLGVTVTRPAPPMQPSFHVIYRFDSTKHLEAWEESPERAELTAEANRHTVGEPRFETAGGLETWFTLPGAGPPPASRLRLAAVTWLGIYPLVAGFVALSQWLVPELHPAISLALVTMIVVLAMAFVVGPVLTRLFGKWLRRAR